MTKSLFILLTACLTLLSSLSAQAAPTAAQQQVQASGIVSGVVDTLWNQTLTSTGTAEIIRALLPLTGSSLGRTRSSWKPTPTAAG